MLKTPPSLSHLSRMYYELSQAGAAASGEKASWPYRPKSLEELIALGAEMSRYDPRLLGILAEFMLKHWRKVSPQALRSYYLLMKTPQTLAVIGEFVKSASPERETAYFMDYLQKGLKPVPTQLYFLNLYAPGGRLMGSAAEEGLSQYKKWGFLGRERPTIDVYQKKTVGNLDPDSRRNILRRLFQEKKQVSARDYLSALGNTISRQQALQDLKSMGKLPARTRGPGAKWVLQR